VVRRAQQLAKPGTLEAHQRPPPGGLTRLPTFDGMDDENWAELGHAYGSGTAPTTNHPLLRVRVEATDRLRVTPVVGGLHCGSGGPASLDPWPGVQVERCAEALPRHTLRQCHPPRSQWKPRLSFTRHTLHTRALAKITTHITRRTIRRSGTRYSSTPLTAKWIAYMLEYQCVINKGALLEVPHLTAAGRTQSTDRFHPVFGLSSNFMKLNGAAADRWDPVPDRVDGWLSRELRSGRV